jgi:hypothetical protein
MPLIIPGLVIMEILAHQVLLQSLPLLLLQPPLPPHR